MEKVKDFAQSYVRRIVDDELDTYMRDLPAILVDGPRGVGKSRTSAERAATVRELDDPRVAAIVRADPRIVLDDAPPVLLDEWQRVPEVWDAVRRAVDRGAPPASFLFTGSSPADLVHSGAGRITTVRMRPLCLAERITVTPTVSLGAVLSGEGGLSHGTSEMTLSDYVAEIVASGFPGLRGLTSRARDAQLDGYIDRLIESDLRESATPVRRPQVVRAWLRAYAAAVGTTASWETIRSAATPGHKSKPAKPTAVRYSDALTGLRILDPIEGWRPTRSPFARLSVGPKHHLADPALAVRLLGLSRRRLLAGDESEPTLSEDRPLLGRLFESLVALTVRAVAQAAGARVFHLRTGNGEHEVDFIVESEHGVVALEATMSGAIDARDFRHLIWLRERIGPRFRDGLVIHTGPEAYRDTASGMGVVPLALLG